MGAATFDKNVPAALRGWVITLDQYARCVHAALSGPDTSARYWRGACPNHIATMRLAIGKPVAVSNCCCSVELCSVELLQCRTVAVSNYPNPIPIPNF